MKAGNLKRFFKRGWIAMRWKFLFVTALAFVLVLPPIAARGQLGLDPCCAIIAAGLNTVSGLLTNVVATPLAQIQQIQQQQADFEQQVVFPVSAINNARALAAKLLGQLRQMSQLYKLPIASATLL